MAAWPGRKCSGLNFLSAATHAQKKSRTSFVKDYEGPFPLGPQSREGSGWGHIDSVSVGSR